MSGVAMPSLSAALGPVERRTVALRMSRSWGTACSILFVTEPHNCPTCPSMISAIFQDRKLSVRKNQLSPGPAYPGLPNPVTKTVRGGALRCPGIEPIEPASGRPDARGGVRFSAQGRNLVRKKQKQDGTRLYPQTPRLKREPFATHSAKQNVLLEGSTGAFGGVGVCS